MDAPHRPPAADFDPALWAIFDQYVHGLIDRRGFLDQAARFAAGAAGAAALLAALSPRFAWAQKVAPDDARLATRWVEVDSPAGHGKARGYFVGPAAQSAPAPVVLVVHENRGLNPHIEDIARRLALEGFVAFAPDALFPLGGYPGDEDAARAKFATLDQAKAREDFVACANWLRGATGSNGRLGAIGFCYGGAMVNYLATRVPELLAGVPFYGGPAPLDQVDAIRAELHLVFAENDPRINAAWPDYEAALKAAGVRYEATVYPGTQHGFNNDTTPRFDATQAAKAWSAAVAFLARTLGDAPA
jgi:carboxymethylenebutenolidase